MRTILVLIALLIMAGSVSAMDQYMSGILEGQYLASLESQAAGGNVTAAYAYNAEVIRINQNSTLKLQPIAIPAIPNPNKEPMKGHYHAADGIPSGTANSIAENNAVEDMQRAFLK
jgi:hypothetical protein